MLFQRGVLDDDAAAVWDDLDVPPAKPPRRRRRFWLKLILVEIAVLVMIAGALVGLTLPLVGDRDYSHRFPPPGANPLNEFAAVAGEYFLGDGLGLNWALSILPDGRYSFRWSGCLGIYHRESGAVKRVDGNLMLAPVKPIEPRMERVFLPLKWGHRTYLIVPARLEEFCDAIIRGDEPRSDYHGEFYLLGLDEPVAGVPELPEPWAAYLRENLVIGTIVDVMDDGRAKLDVGSADGVHPESDLRVQGRSDPTWQLKLVAVNERSCLIEKVYAGDAKEPLKPGWKVVAAREAQVRPNP